MRRFISLFLLVSLLLAGCNRQPAPYVPTGNGMLGDASTAPTVQQGAVDQQLSMVCYFEKGLNPYQVADFTNRTLFSLLYQGLFTVDRAYDPHPILCKRYTVSKDMKTYTFYMEAATFSDGSVLTAEDVAASLRAAAAGPVYQGRFSNVSSITVTEDGGVSILLRTPYENLPLLLDVPIVKADQVNAAFPMGTGAYHMSTSMDGQGLLRRMDWWCSANLLVTASFIPLVEAQSVNEIRDAFEFEGVGVVTADPGSDTYVDYRGDHEVWEYESGVFLYLACNESSKVFSDPALRRALTHAIDRESLVENYYRGFAAAATLPASPDSPYYSKALAGKYGYDALEFLHAVEDAQQQNAEIVLLVNKADSRRVRVCRAIAQMLADCGLKVTCSELAPDAYRKALRNGEYDLHLGQTMLSPNMDLSAFFDAQGALSYGGLSDAGILALCRDALANRGNYYALHQTVMEEGMLCPILFRSYAVYASRGLLSQIEPARDNVFFYTIGKTMADVTG